MPVRRTRFIGIGDKELKLKNSLRSYKIQLTLIFIASSGQSAWNPDDPVSEGVVYEKRLADDIGQQWKDLARALGFHHSSIEDIQQEKGNSKECCIEILVRWLRQNGKGATAGKLADALTTIGLKNLADRFAIKPSDTNRVSHSHVFFRLRSPLLKQS